MRTWATTSTSPPGRTASASFPSTRTGAAHEPQGAPGADRHRRPRDRAVPRTHPAAALRHGELGRAARLAVVAPAGRGVAAAARPRDRLGPRGVRATREPVPRPGGGARRRTGRPAPVRDRYGHGRTLPGGVRGLEAHAKARRPGAGGA